ncbi:protein phosphatase 1 regulatory subunit 3A isoform X2 [Takifugu rubripes]|uniref:protein phosphatase 1 regulatory subunit 3A isoform X2 n=1 Tax=Takifugu rubripes TaxID=31033 RepID=UPI0011458884|nr:protein phosphatase 1 regulatory subunit 3A isoform X2 [Takifugu rubripes]
MSFLSIPSAEGLFSTIKTRKSPGEEASRSPNEEDDEEDEEDDDAEVIRLIPRCSPVPRKRGASIYDETAEYMRIHLALSAGKRVSFADTTGGDLTDVKEFTAYDTDDEDENARWEEEEAKYRKPRREPTYSVRPCFSALSGGALLQAVRTNKLEVEQISPVQDEPLAFTGVIRVANISFHKAVYIRSTMDNWVTYFDHPAEYVQGSHDGDTDRFSFKLSFAPPYVTQDSRIEFVVRYETSEGDFWANNFSMNYAVSLLLSYEDDSERETVSAQRTRGILKPPKVYSMNDEFDSEDDQEKAGEEAGAAQSGLFRPVPVCPVIIHPELDLETGFDPGRPPVPSDPDPPSVDSMLSTHTVSPGEHVPSMSPEGPPPTNVSGVPCASESLHPDVLQPSFEVSSQRLEEPTGGGSSTQPPAPAPAPWPRQAQVGGEERPPSEDSYLQTTDTHPPPALEQEETSENKPTGCACTSAPSVTFDLEVAEGASGPSAAWPDASARRGDAAVISRNLMSSAVFLGGIVSLSIVLQEPSTLFFMGLLLVLQRL